LKKINGSVHRVWYEEPEIWAKEQNSRVESECKFLDKVFRKFKVKKVLDVGCGVGSHCGVLKNLGYSPTGLDLNKKLIGYAKDHFEGIPFFVAEQNKYRFKNKFDAIYSICTVIAFAITNEDLVKTLQNHNRALKKNGVLIISTFNPIVFINKAEYVSKRTDKVNSLGYFSTRKYSVDLNNQLSIDEATFYDSKTGKIVSSDKTIKRMTFPQEMRFFLEQTGFKVLGFYSDFDFKHKTLDSSYMTIVAQKK
jgi:SAM-dependent methyltransferase